MSSHSTDTAREWLEADGLGGFASGTVSMMRTRRYHAVLLVSQTPPVDRYVLVNGLDVRLTIGERTYPLSAQRYAPDVRDPQDGPLIDSFDADPWPTWSLRIPEAHIRVRMELNTIHQRPLVVVTWKVEGAPPGAQLRVRPLISGRDFHALHHRNDVLNFTPARSDSLITWKPYSDVPGVAAWSNGSYHHDPIWINRFQYDEERARGFDFIEDLASPGEFVFEVARNEAALILTTDEHMRVSTPLGEPIELAAASLRRQERHRRRELGDSLDRAADAYIVRRDDGSSVIAGYPWFGDWGRDTFIALRGLCLSTGRLSVARDVLLQWAGAVSEGMLPNRFPDRGEEPEYNSVDASLWYIIAADEFLRQSKGKAHTSQSQERSIVEAILGIVEGYARGTRFGIRMDCDGLLACGRPGVQLTWMDAKIGDWIVTPRTGKPVEVQALWINALHIASRFDSKWREQFERALGSFRARFWNAEKSCLYDVIDVDHVPRAIDETFRPNQILAVGGLPLNLLDVEQAKSVVDWVEAQLLTPFGLRSLSPVDASYVARYEGTPHQRDATYHQGTVWPWLIGPFVEAWVRVRGSTNDAIRQARFKFLPPLRKHLEDAGLGHVSEITDGDPPHTARGCPFQAWSLAELIRLERSVLVDAKADPPEPEISAGKPRSNSRPQAVAATSRSYSS